MCGKTITPGRIVHYVFANGKHRGAIITSEPEIPSKPEVINLQVIMDTEDNSVSGAILPLSLVEHDEITKSPGTWHYLE